MVIKGIKSFISQDQLGNQRHIYTGYWASSGEFPPARLFRRTFRVALRSASSVKPQATRRNTFLLFRICCIAESMRRACNLSGTFQRSGSGADIEKVGDAIHGWRRAKCHALGYRAVLLQRVGGQNNPGN